MACIYFAKQARNRVSGFSPIWYNGQGNHGRYGEIVMADPILRGAVALLQSGDPWTRTRGARRLIGQCLIEKRAMDVVRIEGALERIFALAKSEDPGEEKDGAFVLLAMLDGARQELTVRADFPDIVTKLSASPDKLIQAIADELLLALKMTHGDVSAFSQPAPPYPRPER